MDINWEIKKFEELTVFELYNILKLRAEVFVVEQNCPYQDMDDKDFKSFHLLAYSNNKTLIAYSRILPPKISFKEASIGRVVSSPKYRREGIGELLMKKSIEELYNKIGKTPIRIGAQVYLTKFYEKFEFVKQGEEYLEDNIPHIEMIKK